MRWANAGHLPPLVVNPDGSVAELASWKGDLLLGRGPGGRRGGSRWSPSTAARPCCSTPTGSSSAATPTWTPAWSGCGTPLIELADLPLEELLDELLERLVDGRPEDDVALVAVRLHRQDRPRPAEAGPNGVPPNVPHGPAATA